MTFQLQIDKNSFRFHIIFVGMNPLKDAASNRTKDNLKQAYQTFAQIYPREENPHVNLNVLFGALGDHNKALAEGLEALRLNPSNVVNYGNLAITYLSLGPPDEAKAILDQALSRNLESEQLLATLYSVAFVRGDGGEMQKQLTAAMGNVPRALPMIWEESIPRIP